MSATHCLCVITLVCLGMTWVVVYYIFVVLRCWKWMLRFIWLWLAMSCWTLRSTLLSAGITSSGERYDIIIISQSLFSVIGSFSLSTAKISERDEFTPLVIISSSDIKYLCCPCIASWAWACSQWTYSPCVTPLCNSLYSSYTFLDHPHLQQWAGLGKKYAQCWHGPNSGAHTRKPGTCQVQVVRSVCDWSHGVLTEHSIQNACECAHDVPVNSNWIIFWSDIQLIREANHYIYIGMWIMVDPHFPGLKSN